MTPATTEVMGIEERRLARPLARLPGRLACWWLARRPSWRMARWRPRSPPQVGKAPRRPPESPPAARRVSASSNQALAALVQASLDLLGGPLDVAQSRQRAPRVRLHGGLVNTATRCGQPSQGPVDAAGRSLRAVNGLR